MSEATSRLYVRPAVLTHWEYVDRHCRAQTGSRFETSRSEIVDVTGLAQPSTGNAMIATSTRTGIIDTSAGCAAWEHGTPAGRTGQVPVFALRAWDGTSTVLTRGVCLFDLAPRPPAGSAIAAIGLNAYKSDRWWVERIRGGLSAYTPVLRGARRRPRCPDAGGRRRAPSRLLAVVGAWSGRAFLHRMRRPTQ
jgi:hypothetical protein